MFLELVTSLMECKTSLQQYRSSGTLRTEEGIRSTCIHCHKPYNKVPKLIINPKPLFFISFANAVLFSGVTYVYLFTPMNEASYMLVKRFFLEIALGIGLLNVVLLYFIVVGKPAIVVQKFLKCRHIDRYLSKSAIARRLH